MRSLVIARNTFRQSLHLPVIYVIIIGSVVLLGIVGQLPRFTMSIIDDIKMLKDLAIATATLCGMLVAIFAAVHAITAEIENWTVVTVLSKPVSRREFVIGKFLGLALTLTAVFAVLTVLYTLLVWWGMWTSIWDYRGVYPEMVRDFWEIAWKAANQMWRAMVMCLLQVLVLGAVAVACCVRAPMIISVVIFFMTFVVGHFVDVLSRAARGMGTVIGTIGAFLVTILIPDLESLNFSQEVVGVDDIISTSIMGWGLAYTAVYSAAIVLLAVLLFHDREVL